MGFGFYWKFTSESWLFRLKAFILRKQTLPFLLCKGLKKYWLLLFSVSQHTHINSSTCMWQDMQGGNKYNHTVPQQFFFYESKGDDAVMRWSGYRPTAGVAEICHLNLIWHAPTSAQRGKYCKSLRYHLSWDKQRAMEYLSLRHLVGWIIVCWKDFSVTLHIFYWW